MGYIRDEAIIVTGTPAACEEAVVEAVRLGLHVTSIRAHNINGRSSFLIVPDGSKEGWEDSDKGDAARAMWIEWERANHMRLWLRWVHVGYSEEGDCDIEASWRPGEDDE